MLQRLVAPVADLAEALAHRLENEARTAIATRGHFSIALPGGSVATAFLPRLSSANIDWRGTHVFQADERCVPPDHPDSNFALLRSLLLEKVAARGHRMAGEEPDLQRAAGIYAEDLAMSIGDPPLLDVALLGVGPDGHVASLFPGHPVLEEKIRRVAGIDDAPKPPPQRLTLTLPQLAAARLVIVGAFGREKSSAVRAIADPASVLPVALLVREASRTLLLLDPDAA